MENSYGKQIIDQLRKKELEYLENHYKQQGLVCPECNSNRLDLIALSHNYLEDWQKYQCKDCKSIRIYYPNLFIKTK